MAQISPGKRILMLSPAFLADRRHKRVHGVELFNFLFMRGLVELGMHVTLAAEPRWRDAFATNLAGVPALDIVYGLPFSRPLPVSLAMVPALLRRGPFDLVILGNNGRGILPAAKLLIRLKKARRTVLFAHQFARPNYLKQLRGMPLRVHAVSEAVAADFRKPGHWPVEVSYGILNADRFTPPEPRGAGPLRFGVVGQLDTPWKGAQLALDAWALLPEQLRVNVELHMLAYRDPPQIKTPGVVLHEWIAPERMPDFMRSLDVLIVPSTSAESFSQVTVQGMLTGLPILAFNLPVLTEKLDAGGGLVFTDAAELASLIGKLAGDPEGRRRMGAAARRTALERYDWKIAGFVDRYLSDHLGPEVGPYRPQTYISGR